MVPLASRVGRSPCCRFSASCWAMLQLRCQVPRAFSSIQGIPPRGWPPTPLDTCSPQIRIGYSLRISLPRNSSWSFRGPSGRVWRVLHVDCAAQRLHLTHHRSGTHFTAAYCCDISLFDARLRLTTALSDGHLDCSLVSTTGITARFDLIFPTPSLILPPADIRRSHAAYQHGPLPANMSPLSDEAESRTALTV